MAAAQGQGGHPESDHGSGSLVILSVARVGQGAAQDCSHAVQDSGKIGTGEHGGLLWRLAKVNDSFSENANNLCVRFAPILWAGCRKCILGVERVCCEAREE